LRVNARANAAFLRACLKRRTRGFVFDGLTTFANKLIDCRHNFCIAEFIGSSLN
jgi:hypothetical protein